MNIIDTTYMSCRIGNDDTNDLVYLTQYLSDNLNKIHTKEYKEKIKLFFKFYTFDDTDEDSTITVDLLLEKNQVIKNVTVTRDNMLALARAGILIVQYKHK